MGNPEHPEPTPEHGELTPERRNTRRRRTLAGVAGAATVLAGGALLVAQTRDARQESLPEPPSMAAARETEPAPAASADSAPATSAPPSPSAPASGTPATTQADKKPAAEEKKKSAEEARKEIAKARAKAEADGITLQRPPEAKGGAAAVAKESAVKQWTEPIKNGTVRVTTARHDLTGSSALLLAGDDGELVGDGTSCTNKVRFTRDAPVTERPTLLLCWRTSSSRSVMTMMATPQGKPAPADSVRIIDREWAKLH